MMETQQEQQPVEAPQVQDVPQADQTPDLNTSFSRTGGTETFDMEQAKQDYEQASRGGLETPHQADAGTEPLAQPDLNQPGPVAEVNVPRDSADGGGQGDLPDLSQGSMATEQFDIEQARREINPTGAQTPEFAGSEAPPPEPPGGHGTAGFDDSQAPQSFDLDQARRELPPQADAGTEPLAQPDANQPGSMAELGVSHENADGSGQGNLPDLDQGSLATEQFDIEQARREINPTGAQTPEFVGSETPPSEPPRDGGNEGIGDSQVAQDFDIEQARQGLQAGPSGEAPPPEASTSSVVDTAERDGQTFHRGSDGAWTAEKPVSMMTYDERFQTQGLVEHRGSEKQIENWVEGIHQGQRAYETLRDNMAAGETVAPGEGIKTAMSALGDVADAGLRAKEQSESNEFIREKYPTYEVYREGASPGEPLQKKPEERD